jgi:uncharacterized glyoxalase superfamily protein PhnB
MISDSIEKYSANKTILHTYVPDAVNAFHNAIENSYTIETPIQKQGAPDTRCSFYDFGENYWAVNTQTD